MILFSKFVAETCSSVSALLSVPPFCFDIFVLGCFDSVVLYVIKLVSITEALRESKREMTRSTRGILLMFLKCT